MKLESSHHPLSCTWIRWTVTESSEIASELKDWCIEAIDSDLSKRTNDFVGAHLFRAKSRPTGELIPPDLFLIYELRNEQSMERLAKGEVSDTVNRGLHERFGNRFVREQKICVHEYSYTDGRTLQRENIPINVLTGESSINLSNSETAAFDDWYQNRHMHLVLKIPGCGSWVHRYRPIDKPHPAYVTIYELESEQKIPSFTSKSPERQIVSSDGKPNWQRFHISQVPPKGAVCTPLYTRVM